MTEIARDRGQTEMELLLTPTLGTKFNASPHGEPVALALREHDLKLMRELFDAQPALVARATSGPAGRWGSISSSGCAHCGTCRRNVFSNT